MKPDEIKTMTVRRDADGLYSIYADVDSLRASSPCREEVIGCLASWIYGHRDDGRMPQFMRTPLSEAVADRHFGRLTPEQVTVLRAAGEWVTKDPRMVQPDQPPLLITGPTLPDTSEILC
jgi:hypothetical protein